MFSLPAVAPIVEMQCAMGAFGSGASHVELKRVVGENRRNIPTGSKIQGRYAVDKCLSGTSPGIFNRMKEPRDIEALKQSMQALVRP